MRVGGRLAFAAGLALLVVLVAGATYSHTRASDEDGGIAGVVYTETNNFSDNHVVVFDRSSNGLIVQSGSVSTGGKGAGFGQPGCPSPCPFLDDNNAVAQTDDGHLVFAVNGGSNTISTFRVTGGDNLTLVGQTNSGGVFPYSIAVHDNLLYVLNTQSLNIAGFKIGGGGSLTPIAGSNRPLTADAGFPDLSPRQIGIDNTGKVVVVTLLGENQTPAPPGDINTFLINDNGAAGPAIANNSAAPLPFAFDFDRNNHLVVAEVNDLSGNPGKVTSYSIGANGHLTAIDTESSGGFAPCWIVVSKSGNVYTVNTGAGVPPGANVGELSIDASGNLTLNGATPNNSLGTGTAAPFTPSVAVPEFLQTDITLSSDGRYAYVLSPGLAPVSHIDEYAVGKDGSLTLFAVSPSTLAGGVSGLSAR